MPVVAQEVPDPLPPPVPVVVQKVKESKVEAVAGDGSGARTGPAKAA